MSVKCKTLLVLFLICGCIFLSHESKAVPSYTRTYAVDCARCHNMWGGLNRGGATFKQSGYRAIDGKDLNQVEDDDVYTGGQFHLPASFPISIITGVGYDYRKEKRQASDSTTNTRTSSSFALEDASLFLTSSLGEHLSAFIEFPLYETKAWEFTPTGPAEANDTSLAKTFRFENKNAVFEVAKFWWNNLIPGTPRDSINLLFGISHPPLAYSPGKVRLSVNQYLIYDRRALELISPVHLTSEDGDGLLSENASEYLFRLSEPQIFVELNGMLVLGGKVTDVSDRNTLWISYNLGIANGSNIETDNNNKKDIYGRFKVNMYSQSVGVFAYYSANTYDDELRDSASLVNGGIMSGQHGNNSMIRLGTDLNLNLRPLGFPVSIQNQYMYNRESNPTGFGEEFKWQGGFHQINWQPKDESIAYVRYDWIHGDYFDDTVFGGVTRASVNEWDVVVGFQHLIYQNLKLIGEYRHHKFENKLYQPATASLTDDGFTVRAMIAF